MARAVDSWPHDPGAFTQGLVIHDGRLFESTGIAGVDGQSDVREVVLDTGRPGRRTILPDEQFGEGLAALGGRLYQLTWLSEAGHVYDPATLTRVGGFRYAGEGWGLAADGRNLYMSNGTDRVRVVDPADFRVRRTIAVTEGGIPVPALNEVEWIRGELWANVLETDLIARIEPATGHVVGWVDLARLLTSAEQADVAARGGVANGIAFDSAGNRVLVTGKHWPRLFALELLEVTGH